jgi:hypothetical protein
MAAGGRASFKIDYKAFDSALEVIMTKVDRATKKATIAASQEILKDSLKQVPRETNTLAKSAFYEIRGNSKTGFESTVGYGAKGGRNPKSGMAATEYMIVVHEDLSAKHPVGKAKYLEDPVRAYQKRLAPNFARFIKTETGM